MQTVQKVVQSENNRIFYEFDLDGFVFIKVFFMP